MTIAAATLRKELQPSEDTWCTTMPYTIPYHLLDPNLTKQTTPNRKASVYLTMRSLLVLFISLSPCAALTTQPPTTNARGMRTPTDQRTVTALPAVNRHNDQDPLHCDPCAYPADQEDADLDRREALFSMLGMAWATGTLNVAMLSQPAHATYGTDAKIELPNPIQSMTDRATKQCMVESLGTRECLVYADPENALYQGADGAVLLQRLEKYAAALANIPPLLTARKWSSVTAVLTGPMGELVRTMTQLTELSANKSKAKPAIATVKTDLYAIQAAVDRKQADVALTACQAATTHLVDFVKLL